MTPSELDNSKALNILSIPEEETLNNFLQERFSLNLEAFSKYFPQISLFYKSYQPRKKISFFCLENGVPNLLFSDSDTVFYKSENPIEYCRDCLLQIMETVPFNQSCFKSEEDIHGQIFDKYTNEGLNLLNKQDKSNKKIKDLDTLPLVVLSGVGLGYILGELYERVNVANLVIIEPDPDIFFASMHTFDWKNLLDFIFSEHLSIDIIINNDPQLCFDTFCSIMNDKGVFLSTSPFILVHYSSEFNSQFVRVFKDKTPEFSSLLGFFDDYMFGISHGFYSFFKNNNHFIKKNISFEKYKDVPVFVIGSGPSLDKDISFIQKYQDKAIIIACGSASDSLFHTGIKSDFFANTERLSEIADLVDSIPDSNYWKDVILLCSEVCHPFVQQRFQKSIVFGKENEPFFSYLNKVVEEIKEIRGISNINPLVGNMGVSSATTLGFRNIYLFGLDNGIKVGATNKHSKFATIYQNRGAEEDDGFDFECEGNFGDKCRVNLLYLRSITNISNAIASVIVNGEDIKVYNCSDGALVPNTISIRSEELNDEFDRLQIINKKEICDYIYENLGKEIHLNYEKIETLLKKDEFSITVDSVINSLLSLHNFHNRLDVIKGLSKISSELNQDDTPEHCFHKDIVLPSVQSMFILIINAMYISIDYGKCESIVQHFVDMTIDFLKECKYIYSYLPDYVMGEHRKYYKNNKVGKDMPSILSPNMPPIYKLIRKTYDDPLSSFHKIGS